MRIAPTKKKCPHLMNWLNSVCSARKEIYTPTSFQVNIFCKSDRHQRCPFYFSAGIDHSEQTYVSM
jgi:hypothetical protein